MRAPRSSLSPELSFSYAEPPWFGTGGLWPAQNIMPRPRREAYPEDAAMALSVKPLHPLFVAEMRGIDLSGPIDPETQRAIERTMDQYGVGVLPDQMLDDQTQIAFAKLYGPLEVAPLVQGKTGARGLGGNRIKHREIFDISNLDDDGRILDADDQRAAYALGNQLWHTDSAFRRQSASWSMLHARIVPPDGADTEFVDTRAVYDALPQATKAQIEDLVAEHSIWHSRAKLGNYVPNEEER